MVAALGGPGRLHGAAPRLPAQGADRTSRSAAEKNGYVTGIATRDIGLAVVALGGGRTKPDDVIDHAVGITGLLPIGAEVVKGEPLAIIHARSRKAAEKAEREIRAAYAIGSAKPAADKAIVRRIAAARAEGSRLQAAAFSRRGAMTNTISAAASVAAPQ